jgi:hypothetical protein
MRWSSVLVKVLLVIGRGIESILIKVMFELKGSVEWEE